MTLRSRLALALITITALVFAGSGLFTLWRVERSLVTAVDSAMVDRTQNLVLPFIERVASEDPTAIPLEPEGSAEGLLQVIRPDGSVTGTPLIPIDATVLASLQENEPVFETIDIDGVQHRRLTLLANGRVIQVATDLSIVDTGISDLQNWLWAFVITGIALVGSGGWLLARRLTTPLVQVTAATKQLSSGPELPPPIKIARNDEVGQLAATFNELVATLQASREQQTRLVSDASHELRTPLTTLRVKIDFLEGEPDLEPARRQEIVKSASVELESLTGLMNELVDLALNEASPEEPEAVNLGELLQESAALARSSTGRTIEVRSANTTVLGRPQMIQRAVHNLLTNASRYAPSHEPIIVCEEAGRIDVHDRGPGIHADDLPFVFDRFYRSPRQPSGTGSGIGLSIVKLTADTHDGETWAKDRPGGGASVGFSVQLG